MLQFVVIGSDGTDEGALERRMATRDAHLAVISESVANGKQLMGAATMDENGKMNGSVMVMNFESREELDAWLAREPYVTGKVWDKVEVIPCKVPEIFTKTPH
jgi:uncharacterized protein